MSDRLLNGAYLTVTTGCNLACPHCFMSGGRRQSDELSTESLLEIISQVADLGTRHLTFTGGEPLLRVDLSQLLTRAAQRRADGIDEIRLVTNGWFVTPELAQLLTRRVDRVCVSVDGLEKQHDALRGEGSFERAVQALRFILDEGAAPTAYVTVTAQNVETIPALLDLLGRVGVREVKLRSVWRSGRAIENPHIAAAKDSFDGLLVQKGGGLPVNEGAG